MYNVKIHIYLGILRGASISSLIENDRLVKSHFSLSANMQLIAAKEYESDVFAWARRTKIEYDYATAIRNNGVNLAQYEGNCDIL